MSLGAAYNFTADALRGVQSTSRAGVHQRLVDIQNWGSERLTLRQHVPEIVQKIRNRKFVPDAGALHAADYSHLFRRKSRLELALISATVCGIEFCYSAETAFVSPTLLQIGVPVRYMSLIWCLPPIFGFLLVPFLGSCSDRCESRWGRRRPFVMLLAIAIILGLLFVPQGKRLGRLAGDPPPVTKESLRLARQELKVLQAKIKSQMTTDSFPANLSSSGLTPKYGKQQRLATQITPGNQHLLNSPVRPVSYQTNFAAGASQKSKAPDLYDYLRSSGISKIKAPQKQKLPVVRTTTTSYYQSDPSHSDEEGYDDYDDVPHLASTLPSTRAFVVAPKSTTATVSALVAANDDDDDEVDDDAQSHDVYGGDLSSARAPWAIFFSVVGVVMLDFGCDACQSPCRAYLLDVTVPADHAAGLSTFTVLAGLGGACGYLMGSLHWEQTSFGKALGGQEQTVFVLVAILFFICLFTTLTSFTELPLPELQRRVCVALSALAEDERTEAQRATVAAGAAAASAFNKQRSFEERLNRNYGGTGTSGGGAMYNNNISGAITSAQQQNGAGGVRLTFDPPSNNGTPSAGTFFDNDVAVTTGAFDGYHSFNNDQPQQYAPGSVEETRSHIPPQNLVSLAGHHPSLMDYLLSIIKMPRALRWLCLTNLFCWMSLVSYSLYFTDFVGQSVFGGNPGAVEGSPRHDLYEAGVRYGALCMSFYSVTCSIYSSMIERAVQKFGAKRVYMGGQAVYSVGMLILAFTRNRFFAMLTSCSAGIMYATLFTMPFLLVGHYHSTGIFQPLVSASSTTTSSATARAKAVRRLSHTARSLTIEEDEDDAEMRQIRGLGTDIAIISSQVFAAQFILSSFVGSLVHATGSPVVIVLTASLFAFLGTLAATQVTYLDL